jgi:small conductance mechanosensitive channel
MEQQMQTASRLIDSATQFAVAYGFQILGALVVLIVGLKIADWAGTRLARFAEARQIDVTLAHFLGNVVKLVLVALVVIVTLGNLGIAITPLIAMVGAGAFGATLAIQGLLANYGAGVSIIVSRPFVVGNTIAVQSASGVVEHVSLSTTTLIGEDGERILVPNRRIVGEIIVNSDTWRIVESEIAVAAGSDVARATAALREAVGRLPGIAATPAPQFGLHDFIPGGIVLGLRVWVPSRRYFEFRYAVNEAALAALRGAGIALMAPPALDLAALKRPEKGQAS